MVYFSRGQGSLEYLLLIGGAILVVTVILLVLFTSVLPAANSIVQNNLNSVPGYIPPSGGPLPPVYAGPLNMDWDSVPSYTYAQLVAGSTQTISLATLTNNSDTDVTFNSLTPFFSFTSVQTPDLPLPSGLSSLSIIDNFSGATIFSSTSPLLSAQSQSLSSLVLPAHETWTFTFTFDTPAFPTYTNFFTYPAESHHSLRVQLVDASNTTHRPEELHRFLVYEKGLSASGTLDSFVHTCDGGLPAVAGSDISFGVVTDRCVQTTGTCSYVRDLGYSTIFSFPQTIPSGATQLDTRLVMTQLDKIPAGTGTASDADPYFVVKGSPSCNAALFDNVDSTPPLVFAATITPVTPSDIPNDIKFFDLGGVIIPGESEVSFSLVGTDYSANYSPASVNEGLRLWQSGFNTAPQTPTPFLLVRYTQPV